MSSTLTMASAEVAMRLVVGCSAASSSTSCAAVRFRPGSRTMASLSCAGSAFLLEGLGHQDVQRQTRRHFGFRGNPQKPDRRKSFNRALEAQKPYQKETMEGSPEMLMRSQMYTPEALSGTNLSTNCYRMVLYGLHMPELLDRYAARAVELAPGLNPVDISLMLGSFARAEHRHDQMIRAFTKHIPIRLPHFLPVELAQTCNAYAKLRERDENLFRRFSAEMPHKLPLFEGHQLHMVVNAYARLDIRDDLLFDDVADEVLRRPEHFDAASLTLVASAFGHFRIKHPRLWLTLADWLLQSYVDLRPVDVATVLNAFSAVGVQHDGLINALLWYVSDPALLEELQPSSQALIVNALARLRWDGNGQEEAIRALADRAVVCLEDFSSTGVTQLLHACTKLPETLGSHKALVEGILRRCHNLVPEFGAQSLSLLVHSCATLRQRDVPLLTLVAKAVPPKVGDFTPQALSMTAQGFARLEVRSEILFYLLAGEIVDKMPLFNGQGIIMVLRAFGRLQITNERLVRACKKQVRALAEELTLAEVDSIESALRGLDSLDGATESLLRRVRRDLASSAASMPSHTGVASRDGSATNDFASDRAGNLDLLQRLATEKEEGEPTPAGRSARTPRRADMYDNRPQEPEPVGDTSARNVPAGDWRQDSDGPTQPDLWDLWADGIGGGSSSKFPKSSGSAAAESEEGAATPPSRLREYLDRPERVQSRTRPIVRLSSTSESLLPTERRSVDDRDEHPMEDPNSEASDDGADTASGGGRGRRNRRPRSVG